MKTWMAEEVKMSEQRKKTVVNSWNEWDPLDQPPIIVPHSNLDLLNHNPAE
jgi:hypothetical protein